MKNFSELTKRERENIRRRRRNGTSLADIAREGKYSYHAIRFVWFTRKDNPVFQTDKFKKILNAVKENKYTYQQIENTYNCECHLIRAAYLYSGLNSGTHARQLRTLHRHKDIINHSIILNKKNKKKFNQYLVNLVKDYNRGMDVLDIAKKYDKTVATVYQTIARVRSISPEGTVKYRRTPKTKITCYTNEKRIENYKVI